ncbi:unnamed protein product [Caretta caretta]
MGGHPGNCWWRFSTWTTAAPTSTARRSPKGLCGPAQLVVLVSDENGNTDAFPVAYWTPGPTASR